MNDHDRENLEFLISLNQAGAKQWMAQATTEDIFYALELLNQYKDMLVMEECLSVYDDIEDVSEARALLAKF
jgi:hypothetical protein